MCAVPLSVAQSVIGRYRVESVREIGPGVVCGVGLDSDGGRVTLVAVTITGAGHPDQALAAQDRYRIGAEGAGFIYQMQQFQEERLFAAAQWTVLDRILRETIAYTRERQAFGQSILDLSLIHI